MANNETKKNKFANKLAQHQLQQGNPDIEPVSEQWHAPEPEVNDDNIIAAHELAEAGMEQGAEGFINMVEQQTPIESQSETQPAPPPLPESLTAPTAQTSSSAIRISDKPLTPKNRYKSGSNLQKTYRDQMAIGKLVMAMCALIAIMPIMLVFILKFASLPYDATVTKLPEIRTQYAETAGIFVQRVVEAGSNIGSDSPIISIVPSDFDTMSADDARKLTEVRLEISRLETQKDGELLWVIPDDLRQRAFEDDDFTEFVLAQQKEFAAYYDALDEYGQEIYTQRQRLQDRISDSEDSIKAMEQEKANIQHRLARVNTREQEILKREINYINTDVFDTFSLIEGFNRDLQALQPRLNRLVNRRAATLTPEIAALEKARTNLLEKMGVGENSLPRQYVSPARVQVAEIPLGNVGDAVQKGDVLFRLLPANNRVNSIDFQVAVPSNVASFLQQPVYLLMDNHQGNPQKTLLEFVRMQDDAENGGQWQVGVYRLSIGKIYGEYQRLPREDEALSVLIPDLPLDARLHSLWQRARDKKRFEFDGSFGLNYRLPFFNQDNYIMLRYETLEYPLFRQWLAEAWGIVKVRFDNSHRP